MSEFFNLTCPSCGGKLQITDDIERFACAHCGNEHVVKRAGGIISLSPVVEEIKGVKNGVDKTASELAILRLKNEIQTLEKELDENVDVYQLKIDQTTKKYPLHEESNLYFAIGIFVFLTVAFFISIPATFPQGLISNTIILTIVALLSLTTTIILILYRNKKNKLIKKFNIDVNRKCDEEIQKIENEMTTHEQKIMNILDQKKFELEKHQNRVNSD